MYKNAGKSIKAYADVIATIGIVLSVIYGIVIFAIMATTGAWLIGFLFGVLVSILGCVAAWVGGLLLYAYGEITESVKRMAGCKETDSGTMNKDYGSCVEDTWICTGCGTRNPAARKYCASCNMTKEWSETRNS